MRYAIYYTPPEHAPLTRIASSWLARSAFGGDCPAPRHASHMPATEIAFHTAAARRYGFHATLMAPFTLAERETGDALIASLAAFCRTARPVILPRLELRRLDGFFALMPKAQNLELSALADLIVATFDRFRAPLSESQSARRAASSLAPSQLRNLMRWGYPYVFEDFRFHMTLTGRVDEADATRVRRAIEEHFGSLLEEGIEIASLALFLEPEPGAPFIVRSYHEFGAAAERRSA